METQRGQTAIDLAIGMAIFLSVVLFVFTFVPGIFSPFDLSGEEEPALSDRIASQLAQDVLGSPQEPHILDRYCTVEFFDDSRTDPPTDCAYGSVNLTEQFALSGNQNVRIELSADLNDSGEKALLCWQPETGDGPGLAQDSDCEDDSVTLTTGGDTPASGASTVTARRVVSLHGETVTIEVIVW